MTDNKLWKAIKTRLENVPPTPPSEWVVDILVIIALVCSGWMFLMAILKLILPWLIFGAVSWVILYALGSRR